MSEKLTRNSLLVEVCSNVMKNPSAVNNEDYQKAQEVIKELASNLTPNNRYELGQLIGFLVDDKFNQSVNQYIDMLADVKRVGLGDKAEFKQQLGQTVAKWQAKGSTATRSMVGTKYVTLETDELSVAPAIELEQLRNGQIDFTAVVQDASDKMEQKLILQVQSVLYAYWSALTSPYYATGSGTSVSNIDAIITAIGRIGSPVVLGDVALLQKFVGSAGFTGTPVPESMMMDFHATGLIGLYRGARLLQLNNPLINEIDMSTTLLQKGYAYVIPAGADPAKRPLKVVFEGEVDTYETTYAQSRTLEIAMYKKVGVGLVSSRYAMGMYNHTDLT